MYETAAQTVGVNPAFLNEIKEDHVELRDLLKESRRVLQQSGKRRPRELVHLLLALQDRLATHFSLEEAYGYSDDVVSMAPRLSAQAAALLSEHQTLFVSFCEIVDEAEHLLYREAPPVKLAQIAADYERFREAFDEHERREAELILAAFDDDVGVGD
jgi:hypothetical protein